MNSFGFRDEYITGVAGYKRFSLEGQSFKAQILFALGMVRLKMPGRLFPPQLFIRINALGSPMASASIFLREIRKLTDSDVRLTKTGQFSIIHIKVGSLANGVAPFLELVTVLQGMRVSR